LAERITRDRLATVTILDNLYRSDLKNLQSCLSEIEFIQGDVRDRELLSEITRTADIVFHLAAHSNVVGAEQDTEYAFSTNVTGTLQVLETAAAAKVKRVIFASSREVYGNQDRLPVEEMAPLKPKNHYGASKAAGEMYCRAFAQKGLEVTVLRLANVYGSRDTGRVIPIFLSSALRGEALRLYGGGQVIDFVWIEQVIDAMLRAAFVQGTNGPVNIGSGWPTTVLDLAQRVIAETGSASRIEIEAARPIEVSRFVANTRRMESMLGVRKESQPLVHLPELVRWYRKQASGDSLLSC